MKHTIGSRLKGAFSGNEDALFDRQSTLYLIPHPWSVTGTTSLFASALMRAELPAKLQKYATSGEPTYLETTEIMLKEALFKSGKTKPHL